MLDVTAIPVLKRQIHLPVIVDPSHAGGKGWKVPAQTYAAVAASVDGLCVEMHPTAGEAGCAAGEAPSPNEPPALMDELRGIAGGLGSGL